MQGAVGVLDRRCEPALHIQHHPRLAGVDLHRLDHQGVIHAVEKFLDVQINHPVMFPAACPACRDRIQRRPRRPVAIGVRMELRFYFLFQFHGYHCLRDSVRHSGHAEDSDPAMRFRYLHRLHQWRKVTPRRHPIPYPVQIIAQIGLEFLDRSPVHALQSLVVLDSLISIPYDPLRDTERLFLRLRSPTRSLPESSGCPNELPTDGPAPSLPLHYRGFLTTMSRSECQPRDGTQSLTVSAA